MEQKRRSSESRVKLACARLCVTPNYLSTILKDITVEEKNSVTYLSRPLILDLMLLTDVRLTARAAAMASSS